jgi:hypothetical protein
MGSDREFKRRGSSRVEGCNRREQIRSVEAEELKLI